MDVSPKLGNIPSNYNKIIINKILEKKELVEYPTIKFALNLKFGKWMELFTYKKNINEIIKDYEGFESVNIEIIKKSLIGVEELLKEILEKNDQQYWSIFSFYFIIMKNGFLLEKGEI